MNASHVEFAGDCGQNSLSPTTKARIELRENGVCAFAKGASKATRDRTRKTRDRVRKKGMERLVQGDIINADRKGKDRIDEW